VQPVEAPAPKPVEPIVVALPVVAPAEPPPSPPVPEPLPEPEPVPPPREGTVVLHVGDSFVHAGLSQRLRELFEPLGVRYEARAKPSTITLDWAKRLPSDIAQTRPDLVIITLGANEIGSKYLAIQGRAITRMVRAIGDRPCVWTTPPLWMEESGFFDTIAANVSPCRFFETDRHVGTFLPRRDDVHPTMEGGALWAEKLFEWLLAGRTGDAERPWHLNPAGEDELAPRGPRQPLSP
jgi:hypothetical protein